MRSELASRPEGMEEEFAVALGAGDGRGNDVDVGGAERVEAGADTVNGELVRGGVADDAAFADVLAAGFELGLNENHCLKEKVSLRG